MTTRDQRLRTTDQDIFPSFTVCYDTSVSIEDPISLRTSTQLLRLVEIPSFQILRGAYSIQRQSDWTRLRRCIISNAQLLLSNGK